MESTSTELISLAGSWKKCCVIHTDTHVDTLPGINMHPTLLELGQSKEHNENLLLNFREISCGAISLVCESCRSFSKSQNIFFFNSHSHIQIDVQIFSQSLKSLRFV